MVAPVDNSWFRTVGAVVVWLPVVAILAPLSGTIAGTIISIGLYGWTCATLWGVWIMYLRHVELYGSRLRLHEAIREQRALSRGFRTSDDYILGYLLIICFCVGGSLKFGWSLYPIATLCAALFVMSWLARSLPPTVLYLGASGRKTNKLFTQLRIGTGVYNAYILAPQVWNMNFYDQTAGGLMSRRTYDDDDWRSAVDELSRKAKLIVLDARVDTLFTREEARLLFEKYLYKSVIVCHKDGRCPAIEGYLHGMPGAPFRQAALSDSQIVSFVKEVLREPRMLPTRNNPIGALVLAWNSQGHLQKPR